MQDVGSRGVVATAHAPAGQLHLNILFEAHPGMIGDLEAAIAWSGMSPHDCAQELREHFKASVPVRSCSCLVQSLALLPTRCTPSTMAGYCMRDFGHGHCSIHAKGYTSVELQHCREDFRIRNGRYLHNQRRRVRTTPHLSVAFGLTCWLRLGQMVSFIREGRRRAGIAAGAGADRRTAVAASAVAAVAAERAAREEGRSRAAGARAERAAKRARRD